MHTHTFAFVVLFACSTWHGGWRHIIHPHLWQNQGQGSLKMWEGRELVGGGCNIVGGDYLTHATKELYTALHARVTLLHAEASILNKHLGGVSLL